MADKKQNIFIPKDLTPPRRPMILKYDSDVPKEQIKEKQDVEKQPTIILKTREQSTPKEEFPLSPKGQTSNTDAYQPNKIAQKEKKSAEINLTQSKPMLKPVKLLDENFEFNQAALKFLEDSNTNYLVIGILGGQGVGKSMILNLVAQSTVPADLCAQISNSHEIQNDTTKMDQQMDSLNLINIPEENVIQDVNEFFKFKMQTMDHIERGVHCTKGIDMYVTKDRVILLDCEPSWALSLIDETNHIAMNPRCANIMMVNCLELASFLMAISHVLIAVQDWFADYNFIRYLQTAEMLKPTLSASSIVSNNPEGAESSSNAGCHPHLLLLHNKCQLEDFTPESVKIMQDFYRKAFQRSNLQLNSGMFMYCDSNKNVVNVDQVLNNYDVETCGKPINLFLLPEIYSDYDNKEIYRGHPSFEALAKRLRWLVLGVNRHQITNVPNLSEKGWFHFCNKLWENIKKCTFFIEYEKLLT